MTNQIDAVTDAIENYERLLAQERLKVRLLATYALAAYHGPSGRYLVMPVPRSMSDEFEFLYIDVFSRDVTLGGRATP